jgi:hypothetical protein
MVISPRRVLRSAGSRGRSKGGGMSWSKERRQEQREKEDAIAKLSIAFKKRLTTKKWIKDIRRFSSQATRRGPV